MTKEDYFAEWGDEDEGFELAEELLRKAFNKGWQSAIEHLREQGES